MSKAEGRASQELAESIQSRLHMAGVPRRRDARESSRRVPAKPMVEFVHSRLDPATGELARCSWWVLPEPAFSQRRMGLTYESNERNKVVVIVPLRTAQVLWISGEKGKGVPGSHPGLPCL